MKTPSLLLFFLLSLVTTAQAREPWLTQGSLTASQVQSRAATLLASGAGVVPLQISGVNDRGTARYSLLWGPAPDQFERKIVTGQSQLSFNLNNLFLQIEGWRMTWLNGFHFEGEDYYSAIYRKSDGPAQVVALSDNAASFLNAKSQNEADGYYLENICTFRSSGTDVRYGGFWNRAGLFFPQSQFHINLTAAELATLVNDNISAWKLHNFCGYQGTSGSARYSVMLRPPSRPSFLWHLNVGPANFAAINSNYVGMGWRPAFLNTWNAAPDDIRRDGLWVPNGGLDYAYIDQIDSVVTDAMAARNIPALSLAVSRDGRLIFNRAWGTADIASGELAGTDHRFRIASSSKAITGLAVNHALERPGVSWNLDSKVFGGGALFSNDFGSSLFYSQNERNISLRNLLHHVAGWANDGKLWYGSEPAWGSDNRPAIDWQLNFVSDPLMPGTVGRYSNMGFVIAARAVEYLSGQSFEDYVTDEIFAPCGVTSILRPVVGDRTEEQRKLLEVSYYTGPNYGDPARTGNPYLIDPRRMDGSTAWIARPSDLLLVARRFNGDPRHTDIVNSDTLTEMQTRLDDSFPSSGYIRNTYGLGIYRESYNWGHNGGMAGTAADFMVGNRISFAWAANTLGGISNNSLRTIFADISTNGAWPEIDLFGVYHPYYQNWITEHFAPIEYFATGLVDVLWGPDADPDGDGLPNAMESYLGLDPRVASRFPFYISHTGDHLRITWFRKIGTLAGLSLDYQISSDLARWDDSRPATGTITDVSGGFAPLGYTRQELLVPASTGRRYVRFICQPR